MNKKFAFTALLSILLLASSVFAALTEASVISLTVTSPVIVGQDTAIRLELTGERVPGVKIIDATTGREIADISPEGLAAVHDITYTTTETGNYKAVATIMQPCEICESGAHFTVISESKEMPVPGLSPLLVALVAFGALGIIRLGGGRKAKN